MRNEEIVQYEDLLEMSGATGPTSLTAWLAEHQVRSFKGKGGRLVTTRFALNSALGLVGDSSVTVGHLASVPKVTVC